MNEDDQTEMEEFSQWASEQRNSKPAESVNGVPKSAALVPAYAELAQALGFEERSRFIASIEKEFEDLPLLPGLNCRAILLGVFLKKLNEIVIERAERYNAKAEPKDKVKLIKWIHVFAKLYNSMPKTDDFIGEPEENTILIGRKSDAVKQYGLQTRRGQYLILTDLKSLLEILFPVGQLPQEGLRASEMNLLALTLAQKKIDRESFIHGLETQLHRISTIKKNGEDWVRFKTLVARIHEILNEVLDVPEQLTRTQVSTCLKNVLNFRTKIKKFSQHLEGKVNRLYIPYSSIGELVEKAFEVL